ncbi:MAG: helix-turn-helix domain-containing protein [Caulobacteraceae bacterium]
MTSTIPARSALARWRESQGLTQRELAVEIELESSASVSALETGKDKRGGQSPDPRISE